MGEQPMPTLRKKKNFAELAAERKQLYDSFDGREVDDEKIDEPEFKKINAIEAKLVRAAFNTAADLLIGLKILVSGDNPEPQYWCSFKAALYTRMQEFA
jgi:hypothetical protein